MKPYLISTWHATPHAFSKEKLNKLCRTDFSKNLFWDGTLDAFAARWGDLFLFTPPVEREADYISGKITPYGPIKDS